MCRSMVDIQSPTAEIRRGIKKRKIEDRKKPKGKNIMSASATQGGHNESLFMCSQVLCKLGTAHYLAVSSMCAFETDFLPPLQ